MPGLGSISSRSADKDKLARVRGRIPSISRRTDRGEQLTGYSEWNMMSPFQISIVVISGITLLMGITINTYLAAAISNQCLQSRSLPTASDLLLLALALVNAPLQCCASGDLLFYNLWTEFYERNGLWKMFFIPFPILVFASFWTNTWLCVFYCAKIVNLPHPLYIRLKLGISGMVPWFRLASLLMCVAINGQDTWELITSPSTNSTTTNATQEDGVHQYSLFHMILLGILGCFIPLIMTTISAVLVLFSLYRHTPRMLQHTTGFNTGPSIEAHNRAAKTIPSLLTL
ncbi:taste receptor type 2 member 40-like [Ambystoma mexicanum]|uniref:taste receptor type 2 member 40-like n=1 Tax=Ambystoma mexicanum TaxID=8296 RepID=UPI0037E7340B